ncbi:MAG: hypothetical protein COB02_02530 [Candidatus Cloacimonadota bacterium]|nr:MAG: hypothetical protein COB02_02530 [Candidatus Cloacimonadota bacterium]
MYETLRDLKSDKGLELLAYEIVLEIIGNKLYSTCDKGFTNFIRNHLSSDDKIDKIYEKYPKTLVRVLEKLRENLQKRVEDLPVFESFEKEVRQLFLKEHCVDFIQLDGNMHLGPNSFLKREKSSISKRKRKPKPIQIQSGSISPRSFGCALTV